MKIGFDAKRFYNQGSSLGYYARDLIRILAKHIPDNKYLLLDKKPSDCGQDILDFKNVSVLASPSGFLSRQLHIGVKAQLNDCDIFHGLAGELPLKWDKTPIKKVVTIHDLIFMIYPHLFSYADRKAYFVKIKKAIEDADVVVAISEQTKNDIVKYFHVPEKKIKVIYKGCSPLFKNSYTEEEKEEVQKKFALPKQFLLNVGTIDERKNGLSIVKAIKDTQIPLVFVGKETHYTGSIKEYIEKNGISNQVQFLKNISDKELAIIFQLATIFIYPAIYEGFGLPIIEALYSNTPVITNKDGVFREAGGKDSVYVDVNNIENINEALVRLWTDEKRQKEMQTNGLQFVQKFNDEVLAKEWDTLYSTLLNKI